MCNNEARSTSKNRGGIGSGIEEWEQLDMDKINKILLTMPEGLAAVKKANGGAIPLEAAFHNDRVI